MMAGMAADLLVVGGGIAGAAAAYRAARDGLSVTLVDDATKGRATAAGAGILSHAALRELPAPSTELFRNATAYYRHLVELLAEDGEGDLGYAVVGELIVAPGRDGGERLEAVAARLAEENAKWDSRPLGEISLLSAAEARRLFPPLREGLAAVHTTEVARVDGRLLRDALVRATERRGGRLVRATAKLRPAPPGAPPAIEVNDGVLGADAVILAAGAWSQALGAPLGLLLPVTPQRGQIIHLSLPGAPAGGYPVLSGHGHDYVVCFPPDRIVLGATREDAAGFDYRATAGGVRDVLGRALEVAPGLATASLQEIRIGFRPASPDGMPMLGPVPGHEGLHVATGFGPSGLTLAPFASDTVAALATGSPPWRHVAEPALEHGEELLASFSPGRFAAGRPA